MRLAILTSHPIQYYAPLFREISRRVELKVFFAHRATPQQQAAAGFGTAFDWDIDLLSGYDHEFLENVSRNPGSSHFAGCDTPGIHGALSSGNFDALLVAGWHLKCFWQGIWAAKRLGVPVIVRGDSHLDTPRSAAKRLAKEWIYPALLRVFDSALYVGARNRDYWRHYGYPDERLFFSPHCVDNAFFAERATPAARAATRARLGVPTNVPVALFAGKLIPFKRPLDVVQAAARVRAQGSDLHVLIAGSGELEPALRMEADQLNVPVHFMGFQNQSAMPAAYSAADFLVIPSNGRESWGLVANEAIACTRPVIVSDAVGCAPDLALDSRAGRRFPMGNIEALAQNIEYLVRNPACPNELQNLACRYSLSAAAHGITTAASYASAHRSGINQAELAH